MRNHPDTKKFHFISGNTPCGRLPGSSIINTAYFALFLRFKRLFCKEEPHYETFRSESARPLHHDRRERTARDLRRRQHPLLHPVPAQRLYHQLWLGRRQRQLRHHRHHRPARLGLGRQHQPLQRRYQPLRRLRRLGRQLQPGQLLQCPAPPVQLSFTRAAAPRARRLFANPKETFLWIVPLCICLLAAPPSSPASRPRSTAAAMATAAAAAAITPARPARPRPAPGSTATGTCAPWASTAPSTSRKHDPRPAPLPRRGVLLGFALTFRPKTGTL